MATDESSRRQPWLLVLPLLAFLGLAAIFWFRLGDGDPSRIPSALIGSPAPQTALRPLQDLVRDGEQVPGLDPAAFKGKVSIVNVWASWCTPCHDEAALLTELSKDTRLQLVGINYKDGAEDALRFLGRHGNPFGILGVDGNGRAAIEWGVYGVPETFVVGRDGKIVYRLVGPVTPENIRGALKSEIEKAVRAIWVAGSLNPSRGRRQIKTRCPIHGYREVKDGAAALVGGHPHCPSWASIIDRQIDSPMPMPCGLVVNIGLNIRSAAPGSKPFPVSSTDTITYPE
jgi:cytochrome c biogenesis protein CcmG/thiol:disulfide interchange protein DsbE